MARTHRQRRRSRTEGVNARARAAAIRCKLFGHRPACDHRKALIERGLRDFCGPRCSRCKWCGQSLIWDGVTWALHAATSRSGDSWEHPEDFGPREDEGGEGVKPDDPPDGAEPALHSQGRRRHGTAPDAENQEGAESSRVGGPSDPEIVCICTDADDPNDHRKDCPMWRAAP